MPIKITTHGFYSDAIIDYTNYRGERAMRRIRPLRIQFGATSLHPVEQWLLVAFDIERDKERTFAMEMIHSFKNDTSAKEDAS